MKWLGALALMLAGPAAAQSDWTTPQPPFRIAGNLHYVGTAGLSAYLLTDPAGHILIDGTLAETAPQVLANIRTLGFRPEDVKLLLINHAHFDHAAGLAALKRATGARLLASAADRPDLEAGRTIGRTDIDAFPPVKVDGIVRDGERLRFGGTMLTALLTPGHTRGCTSFRLRVQEAGRPLDVLLACSLSIAGQPLAGDRTYPNAARDFRATFARLRRERADIFLNFHPDNFALAAKRARQQAGDPLAFVDPAELGRQLDAAERGFAAELAKAK